MSAMSASPPLVALSLIAEHKVSGNKPPPAATPQQVGVIPPVAAAPPVAVAPPAVASQPQTNGMEPAQSPPAPAVAPAPPPISASPPSPPPPPQSQSQSSSSTTPNNAQGTSQAEGGPVAPGSGTSASGGSGEVEGSSAAVGDVPPVDAQPCVPPTPATVPLGDQTRQEVQAPSLQPQLPAVPVVVASASTPAPEAPALPPAPAPPVQSLPPAPVEASPPPPSVPAALPPAPAPVPPPSVSTPPQENAKPSRTHKRKLQPAEGEVSSKKSAKVEELDSSLLDGRKSKRARLPTQPYQSPIPELNMIAKMNNTPKASEEKLIVFYRNEFLAVRNAEGGFYVCQAMQNIYRSTPGHRSKIKIRWFTQSEDVFTPDFYDSTEFDCILTNLNLDRMEKDKYKLPGVEKQRTESILKRAIDAEKGIGQSSDATLTEEHPDGLDLSLYRHEDQLKKSRKKKDGGSKKRAKAARAPAEVKKPTRTSARSTGIPEETSVKDKALKSNEKIKSRTSKKRKRSKKNDKSPKKKEPDVGNNKKELLEMSGRKSANGAAALSTRKTSDKTKSAVAAKAASKGPPAANSQSKQSSSASRQTRLAAPKQ